MNLIERFHSWLRPASKGQEREHQEVLAKVHDELGDFRREQLRDGAKRAARRINQH